MAQEVVLLHSGMTGAPATTLTTAGGLIAVLDACLVNGFNSVGISSITRSGSVATATTTGTHNFEHGRVVEIAGADQASYNGKQRITVTGSNTFTFAVSGSPATPATGTITAKYAAAGWTKPVSGTNRAGYLTGSPSLGHYMQVEDDNPYADSNVGARTRMAVALSAIDTATQLGEQCRVQKAAGTWVVVADHKTCYLIMNASNVFMFGEFKSYKADDAFNWFQNRGENASISATFAGQLQHTGRSYPTLQPDEAALDTRMGVTLLRGVSQTGGHISATYATPSVGTDSNGNAGVGRWQLFALPNAADGSVPLAPILVVERGASEWRLRGEHRGMYSPAARLSGAGFTNNLQALTQTTIDGSPRDFVVCRYSTNSNHQLAFDITDTWG